jgi:hypothetical protein
MIRVGITGHISQTIVKTLIYSGMKTDGAACLIDVF